MPRTLVARSYRSNSAGAQETEHSGTELRVAVKEQVLLVGIAGEPLSQLLYEPLLGRMLRAIEVQNLPVAVADQKQAVKNAEIEREEIHSGESVWMVLEEDPPALTAPPAAAQTALPPALSSVGTKLEVVIVNHDGSKSKSMSVEVK